MGVFSDSEASLAESALVSEESLEARLRKAASSFGRGLEGAVAALSELEAISGAAWDLWKCLLMNSTTQRDLPIQVRVWERDEEQYE